MAVFFYHRALGTCRRRVARVVTSDQKFDGFLAPILEVWPVLSILAFSASVLSIGGDVGDDEACVELARQVEAAVRTVLILKPNFIFVILGVNKTC